MRRALGIALLCGLLPWSEIPSDQRSERRFPSTNYCAASDYCFGRERPSGERTVATSVADAHFPLLQPHCSHRSQAGN